METLFQLLAIVGACFLAYFTYQTIKNNPDAFNKASINNSFLTMGLLGLGLIVFVALLVWIVRH